MDPQATGEQAETVSPDAPPPPPESVGSTVSDIAATLSEERPEVQRHVVDAAQANAATDATAAAENVDSSGTVFDALKHTGTKTTKGLWRSKKAGKETTGSKLGAPAQTSPAATTSSAVAKEAQARAGGKGAANLFMAVAVGLGGNEWQPRILMAEDRKTVLLNEKEMLEGVFADYFVATGKADLPPGWALAAGIGMYSVPRFQMPVTRSRMTRIKEWAQAKYLAFRARKAGLRPKQRTHQTEHGTNGE